MGESKITSCLHAHENENISKSLSKNFRCENRSARFEGIDSQDLMSFRLKESQNSLFKVGGRIEWFELIKGEEWKCESVYSLSFFFFFFLSLLSFFFFFSLPSALSFAFFNCLIQSFLLAPLKAGSKTSFLNTAIAPSKASTSFLSSS